MSKVKKILQLGLRLSVLPLVTLFYLLRRFIEVELVLPNVTLFGHLALEPEKILCQERVKKATTNSKRKRLLIWSFGKKRDQVNTTLVKIWKRSVFSMPAAIIDAIHRSSKWFPKFEIKIMQFDKLHENDHVLDSCGSHLQFKESEVQAGRSYLRSVGLKIGDPYVCLIVREAAWAPTSTGASSSGALRSRSFEDFILAAEALADLGVTVIKLGAPGTFKTNATRIIDYANSSEKSKFLDVYLPANATCAVSTMSGPDAVALVGRVPVLYVDIAQYSLCFAGTKLTTWVPAVLKDKKSDQFLSLTKVFDSGAGRFLGSAAFDEAGIAVINSTPESIRDNCLAFYANLNTNSQSDLDAQQITYQNKFHSLLSRNSVSVLGPFSSRLSEKFLRDYGDAFLS